MDDAFTLNRRTALKTICAGTIGGATTIGTASAEPQDGCDKRRGSSRTMSREYIRTSVPYRHIVARPLPMRSDGSINREQLVIDSSMVTLVADPAIVTKALCVVDALEANDIELAMSRWEDTIRSSTIDSRPLDLNALIQFVLREAYLEATSDLRFYAMQVKYFTDQGKKMRESLLEARRIQNTLPARERTQRSVRTRVPREIELNDDIERLIDSLEEQLESLEEDSELANVDLQNSLQKQQKTLQLMSNISKQMHDTAMAIIRKIGG